MIVTVLPEADAGIPVPSPAAATAPFIWIAPEVANVDGDIVKVA